MAGRRMCGGPTEEMEATEDIQKHCDEVKDEIMQGAGKDSVGMFKALKYKSQLVAGTNYFVKIQVDDGGECVHVRLFEALPCHKKEGAKSVELAGVQAGKQVKDAVEYF